MNSARLYSLLHTGSPGDEAFYLQACNGAGTVLELGCGSGRLLAPLARAGLEVVGLDRDRELLELARERLEAAPQGVSGTVELVPGDMTSFRMDRRFDRVLVPFNGLSCLQSDEDVLACLKAARLHLQDEGRLLFDVYRVDPGDEPEPGEPRDGGIGYLTTIRDGEREIDVLERDVWDPEASTVEVTYLFSAKGEPPARQTILHRYMAPAAILGLVEDAGLRVVRESGGFHGEPGGPGAVHMVVEAG